MNRSSDPAEGDLSPAEGGLHTRRMMSCSGTAQGDVTEGGDVISILNAGVSSLCLFKMQING